MKKIDSYQCEHCGSVYPTADEAEACEKSHHTKLNIIDMKFEPSIERYSYGYPTRILVEIEDNSGCLAEYALQREGSVEEFDPYHPDEYYDN